MGFLWRTNNHSIRSEGCFGIGWIALHAFWRARYESRSVFWSFLGSRDDGTKSKYMDRHATWRHKIIRPSVARPIFDHMRWHTKSKPNKKSQDRKGTLAQARPPARPNHKITRVPFRTLGDLISTSELHSMDEINSPPKKKQYYSSLVEIRPPRVRKGTLVIL